MDALRGFFSAIWGSCARVVGWSFSTIEEEHLTNVIPMPGPARAHIWRYTPENRRPPQMTEHDLTAAGRSFALLTSVTQAWGVESLADGTRMWAKLPRRSS